MSKRSEEATMKLFPIQMELVPLPDGDAIEEDVNRWKRMFVKIGYEQAEKDIKSRLLELIEEEEKFWDDGEMIFRRLKKELNEP